MRSYNRGWLGADTVAGPIVWSVDTPQCVAYAQIAGLPAQAGLMAAPGAMIGYALIGRSRSLVVSATTATSALSAAAVGPLAHGDVSSSPRCRRRSHSRRPSSWQAPVSSGWAASPPRAEGGDDGISCSASGLTITIGQLPAVFGVNTGSGNFFPRLVDLIDDLGSTHAASLAVGATSIALLLGLRRLAPKVPGTLVVLALAIATSAALHLSAHGVDVICKLPSALPHPSIPHVGARDFANLLPAAFGAMLLSTEAVGVARACEPEPLLDRRQPRAGRAGRLEPSGRPVARIRPIRGCRPDRRRRRGRSKSQLASIIAAGLILLTGAFLAPLFTDLPQATLAAIVIGAVSGFFRVDELRRFARLRVGSLVFAPVALAECSRSGCWHDWSWRPATP